MKNNRDRGRRAPAFLADNHRGMEPRRRKPTKHWRPRRRVNALGRALRALPRVTADLGYSIASHRGARVEVLPGAPTTIIFSVKDKLTGMVVVPWSPEEARKQLGLPPMKRRIPSADAMYEEARRYDAVTAEDSLIAWQSES